jgi:hypothetical protein
VNKDSATFLMTVAGTLCWAVCFWWMWRISVKQSRLMDQLHAQGRRIEKLSKVEHDLIKEVHPQVSEIKESMNEMITAVKENTASQPADAGGSK